MRCLEKDPAERYPSAGAVADDLERFLKGEMVEARPGGLWQMVRRWARREPTLVYRLAALLTFMVITHVNYHLAKTISYQLHIDVLVLLAVWIVTAVLCQQWLKREGQAERAKLAWTAADVTLLTTLLAMTGSQSNALLVGYPFLIAASGLWFQVHLVWFTTAACEAAYATLILGTPEFPVLYLAHYHIIFMVAILVEGFIVAYQVQRIRVLNRYYENRPLP
jgi:serine/threonine-protein kinase